MAIGFLALLMSIYMEATVFSAALFAATVLTASIGSAVTLIVLDLNKNSSTILVAVISGFIVAVGWRIMGYDAIVSDGFVGFIVALLFAVGYDKIFEKK